MQSTGIIGNGGEAFRTNIKFQNYELWIRQIN